MSAAERPPSTPARAWATALLPGLLLAGAALKTLGPVRDPDTWWHLRSGSDLLTDATFVGPDPWGGFAARTWIRHQWLGDATLALANRLAGLAGVAWVLPLMTVLALGATYRASRGKSGVLVASLVTTTAMLAMSDSLSIRPQVLSFAFAAVTAGAWAATATDLRVRWWLIPLTWCWACWHGLWVIGPATGAAWVLGLALAGRPLRVWGRLALIPALSILAAALTPVGPALLRAPGLVQPLTPYLQEWQRPSLLSLPTLAALGLGVVGTIGLARQSGRDRWAAVPAMLLATGLVLATRRTVGIGAVLYAPIAAAALQTLVGRRPEAIGRTEMRVTSALAVLGLVGAAALAPTAARQATGMPQALSGPLQALPAGTVICASYEASSWLRWRHPTIIPTIDGRTEIYTVEQVRASLRFADGDVLPYVAAHECAHALVRADSAAATALRAAGWTGPADGWVLLEAPPGGRP